MSDHRPESMEDVDTGTEKLLLDFPAAAVARLTISNPAKRNAAQQPAAAVDPAAAFGGSDIDQAALEKAMADFQLPPELRSRFGK